MTETPAPGKKSPDFTETQGAWERIWALYSEEDDTLLADNMRADWRQTQMPGPMNCECRGIHLMNCPIVRRHAYNRHAVRAAIAKARKTNKELTNA